MSINKENAPPGAGLPTPKPREMSDAQLRASKRNFAIFTLKGMQGHLVHLQGQISEVAFSELTTAITWALHTIPGYVPAEEGSTHGTHP